MWHFRFRGLVARLLWSHRGIQRNNIIIVFCLLITAVVLVSCGSAATGQIKPVAPTPTLAPSPTVLPTPTFTPTPRPIPPTATPTVVPQPTQPPIVIPPTQPPVQPSPAILDLRPSSMSIVGHLDCQKNGTFVCFARVLSGSSNQSNLNWSAFTNVPGGIAFSPASGVLAPGQSVLVTITVPFNACTPGLFFFRGPVNTHTITWAC